MVHPVAATLPTVISPCVSSPTIVGLVPQLDNVGLVLEATRCPVFFILNSVEVELLVDDAMINALLPG